MRRHLFALGGATFLLGISAIAVQAAMVEPTTIPPAPTFAAQGKITFVGRNDIETFKALPAYHEPDWVTKNFVDTGKLPPVKDRLPKEPLVFKTGDMPDGIGQYGGTLRHVIGGRPQGWNWHAGQVQGWGGVSYAMWECLTRTGPLFHVKADELEPLPNLAKSWEWSKDGHELTMHLIEGAKWSDGAPFNADDVMFFWNDNVLDPNVAPAGRCHAGSLRRRHDAEEDRRLHGAVDVQGRFPQAVPLRHGVRIVLPGAGPYHEAAAPEVLEATPTTST